MRTDETRLPLDIEIITITYEGLDADSNSLDMALLAQSIEGFGRIISTVASYALTSQYYRYLDVMPVRAKVQEFRPGSFTVKVVLDYLKQGKLIPDLGELIKTIAKWVMARQSGKKEANQLQESLNKALDLNGILVANNHESHMRTQALLERMAEGLLPAARKAVAPVGESCARTVLALGQEAITVWDERDKAAIDAKVTSQIQPIQTYTVYVSELDIATGSAKVSFGPDDQARIKAKITDPVVGDKDNPYAMALAKQSRLIVSAKAEFIDGELVQMYISDSSIDTETDAED